jgi:proteic killer suppression protein
VIASFADRETEALHFDQFVRRFQSVARAARRKLLMLDAASRLEDLQVPPGNRLEALRGDLQSFHAIRVNDQWRVVFRWANGAAHDVRLMDYH